MSFTLKDVQEQQGKADVMALKINLARGHLPKKDLDEMTAELERWRKYLRSLEAKFREKCGKI